MEPIAVVPRYRLSTKPWVIAVPVVFLGLTLLARLPGLLLLMVPFLLQRPGPC
jgi:hypothetical protein